MARSPTRTGRQNLETIPKGQEPFVDPNELYSKLEEKYGTDRAFELIQANTKKDGTLNFDKLNSKLEKEYSRDFSSGDPYGRDQSVSGNNIRSTNSAPATQSDRPNSARATSNTQDARETTAPARAPSSSRDSPDTARGTLGTSTAYANEVYDRIEQQLGTKRTAKIINNHLDDGILNTNKLYNTLEKFTSQKDLNKIFFPENADALPYAPGQQYQPNGPVKRLAKDTSGRSSATFSNEGSINEGAFILERPASPVQSPFQLDPRPTAQPFTLSTNSLDERPRGREGRA